MDEARTVIIEAAGRLLRAEGARGVTTRAVSQAAGVQPPTIYRLFGDKDGLLDALAEHALTAYVGAKVIDTQQDPFEDLKAGWHSHIEFGLANPDLFQLYADPRRRRSPAVAAGDQILRQRVHRLAATGRLRVSEERAVQMIQAAGRGAVLAMLAGDDPGLGDAMFDAVVAAVLTDVPVVAANDATTVAVALAAVVDELPALSAAEKSLMSEWLNRAITS
ncbi:TetR/AcrR family transcriptional regulator [Paractinoplanes ferrugineus]|uniref:TetR family transcriptional regulator n=1 Tax=Paractinoplanes ferrugineus TaxID=113564 RepID=A0A919J3T4_9ACTN|nr:TetR/AcrR family transcriptional regulator [Actinoplanes ferrugineus]GIE13430.1 TetR family transcriptional regulator [Actinoplanes ferrugineus]